MRLSNGSFDVQANTRPDIRGFALRIQGVSGPAALGGVADHQDFLLINHDRFNAIDSDSFVEFVTLAAGGQLKALWTLFRRHGLAGLRSRIDDLQKTMGKPFRATPPSASTPSCPMPWVPMRPRCSSFPRTPQAMDGRDAGLDITRRLAAGPISYGVQLQFYTDPISTPIEDHRAVWTSPAVPVARLTLLAPAEVEALAFDPWGGLAAHRPLGEVMRARKGAYLASQKGRA